MAAREGLTASWLAVRLGLDPARIEAMQRAGTLISRNGVYPSWQFLDGFRPLPGLDRVIAAGRAAGLGDDALCSRLERRQAGLVGGRHLVDLLLDGHVDAVVDSIAAPG